MTSVEKAMMVRAEHDDVLDLVPATVFAGDDVTDVVSLEIPAADSAFVDECGANEDPESCIARVFGNAATTSHQRTMADAEALA